MKKIIALVLAVLIVAGAVFAGVYIGLPIMSMKKTADALSSSYDGHYDITLYEEGEGDVSDIKSYNISLDRTGNVFAGEIPLMQSSEEGAVSLLPSSCDGYLNLDNMDLAIDLASLVESIVPDSLLTLAEKFGFSADFEGYYLSLAQISEVLEAVAGDNAVTEIENLLEQAKNMDTVLSNCSVTPILFNSSFKNASLVKYGFLYYEDAEDYQYFKISGESIPADIYVGCPRSFDESNLKLMIYVDFTDEGSTDYVAAISAEKAETSVSMPALNVSDDQIDTVVSYIEKAKKLLGK